MIYPRRRIVLSGLLAIAAASTGVAQAAASKEALTARRDKIVRARDSLRSLAAKPRPSGLPEAEARLFSDTVASIREVATGLDGIATKLTQGLSKSNPDLDSLAELEQEQQLRLQGIMDRMNRANAAASNALKAVSDSATQVVRNLK